MAKLLAPFKNDKPKEKKAKSPKKEKKEDKKEEVKVCKFAMTMSSFT